MADEMIPVVLFLVILVGYVAQRYFRFRGQQEIQMTLRLALEQGNALTPEALAVLVPKPDQQADRRRGALSLMLGLAILGFALLIGDPEAIGPLAGLACFPLFLSGAYFWLSRTPEPDYSAAQ